MKEITKKLEEGIKEIYGSEKYKAYLNVMSKFHKYSYRNLLLILLQKPDASLVAGYSAWKNKFGRQVKKGEKGITILAPISCKIRREDVKTDENGEKTVETTEVTVTNFKTTSIFDISQTEGQELPSICNSLIGEDEMYKRLFEALVNVCPIRVEFEKIQGTSKGYYSSEKKRIAIREGMSGLQNLKTLIHETAHAMLHDFSANCENIPDKRTREVQAESVAYTVCSHYGIDTSDYSFGYIASWSSGKELPELMQSLEVIQNTSDSIICAIDNCLSRPSIKKQLEDMKNTEPLKNIEEEISL